MDLMSDDVKNGIVGMLGRRLSSPVVMNFSIAWCIWNYKFIVILLSANTATNTFILIHNYIASSWWGYWGSFVILPFISMLGFVLVNPLAELLFYKYQWMMGRVKKGKCSKVIKGKWET